MGAAQAAVLAAVAEKCEVVGAKSVWATSAGTRMHIWRYIRKGERHPSQWSGRAGLCWKDGDEHVAAASMPSLLLVVYELL